MKTRLVVELKIITPVIINSGDNYDFLEIYPFEKDGIKYFNQYNTSSLFDGVDSKSAKEFINKSADLLFKKNDVELSRLRRKFFEHLCQSKPLNVGKMLFSAYDDLKDKPMRAVSKIMTNPMSGRPYIPGSSIKGAIRTALLEHCRAYNEIDFEDDGKKNKPNRFEQQIINNDRCLPSSFKVNEDVFKYIDVSDFMFSTKGSTIRIGKIINDNKIPIYTAMTDAYFPSKVDISAKGIISIDDQFFKEVQSKVYGRTNKQINYLDEIKKLVLSINSFYYGQLDKENYRDEFKSKPMLTQKEKIESYKDDESACFIRLGHYIGIQNITFEIENPNPPTPKRDRYININGGKISKIEGNLLPGMCILKFPSDDEIIKRHE